MSYALGVEHHYMVFHLVNGVRASGVEVICEMDFVRYVIQEIHAFMIIIRIPSIALPTLTTLHTPHTRRTRVIPVETILISVMIVRLGSRLIMSRNRDTLKTIILIHMIHRVFHNNIFVVPVVEGPHETCQCDQLIFDEPHCKNCGGPRMNFQCQPMNQNLYNFNSSGFDQTQPPQSPVIHQPPQEMSIQEMEDLKQQYFDEMKRLINSEYHDEIKIDELKGNFNKIFSSEINPLYNEVLEDLDPIPLGNDHFNVESDLIESLLNKDTMITSPKIDFILEEFAGEPALINPIPPGIAESKFDPKVNIRLIKKLLYDNSSPRPPEELNSKNDFEKENSGSTNIHTDISLPEYESFYDKSDSASEIFNDDLAHIISPSKYGYVYADDESDSGDLTTKVVDDISDNSTR
nr:hypothetical protein [Tanacetum cinerariifolium]